MYFKILDQAIWSDKSLNPAPFKTSENACDQSLSNNLIIQFNVSIDKPLILFLTTPD